ncbi:hypothetical protein GGF32_007686 [Allomyces javanicus]|nr:hypothetical protein GGF32_007686 [Allomyces javanicus]
MNNFMINSNNEAILPLTATGRRVFCLKVSNIHRCDEDYFEQLAEFVKANANKIFTYIMNLDLKGIRLSKFPRNEDRDAMAAACIDPVAALIKEFVDYGGFPRNLMEPGRAVEVEKVMDSRDIYSMYQKYVERPVDTTKRGDNKLFIRKRKVVDGRKVTSYEYCGPAAMDLSDDDSE